MEAELAVNDKILFYKYLDNATKYFEFGSGGSTYQASLRKNIKQITSVESDIQWYTKMKQIINNANVELIYVEMYTIPNTWGFPGPNSKIDNWVKYSNIICEIDNSKKDIDLVLIDGRFRVACCLKCFNVVSDDCKIIFDDFLTRPYYHVVLNYYEIIDKTSNNRLVVLKKKNTVAPSRELIFKYEIIPQ